MVLVAYRNAQKHNLPTANIYFQPKKNCKQQDSMWDKANFLLMLRQTRRMYTVGLQHNVTHSRTDKCSVGHQSSSFRRDEPGCRIAPP